MLVNRCRDAIPTGRRRHPMRSVHGVPYLLMILALSGCALTPAGTKQEQARLAEAGKPFEPRLEDRTLPEIPASPTWHHILHRALLANGELESAYFDWKTSVQRIETASAYPNSNVMLGYSYMFSSERMKTFDRQTFSAGFDSSMNLSFPTKVAQQGRIALDEARASGERFRAAKFDLQRRVLTSWTDYALLAERLRIEREQLVLTRMSIDAIRARARIGGVQRDLLKSDTSLRTSEDAIKNTEARIAAARAMLNGMLGREPNAPLDAPAELPAPRQMPEFDDVVLAAAVDQNPELAALAHQVRGRSDALELARMQWIPNITPSAMFTGGIAQAIGAGIMLPTNVVAIRGGIREAEAMLRGSEAALRQVRSDRAALLVATLVALRNSERQARLFENEIIPLAEGVLTNARQGYAAGSAMYLDVLDAERVLLDARLVVAESRTAREQRLAELEALMGTDIETLLNAASPTPTNDATGNPATGQPAPSHKETRHDR